MMQHQQRKRDARRNLAAAVLTISMVAVFVIHNIRHAQSRKNTTVTAIKKQRLRGSSFVALDAQPFVGFNCITLRCPYVNLALIFCCALRRRIKILEHLALVI